MAIPCIPAAQPIDLNPGLSDYRNAGAGLTGFYNTASGGITRHANCVVLGSIAGNCLFGSDGKLWGDDEETLYDWVAVQHIYSILFDEINQSELPPVVQFTGFMHGPGWGTPA